MQAKIGVLLALACAASVANAQDVKFQFAGFRDIEAAFASQQQTIDHLQARLASLEDVEQMPVAADEGCCCDVACCCGSWYAGAAAVIAKPHFEDEVDVNDGSDEVGYDFEITPRIWVGYRNCDGLGLRATYWIYDESTPEGDDDIDSPYNLEAETLDLDVTQTVCLGPVHADLFGGFRYAMTDHRDVDDEGLRFEGVGPTLGTNLLVPVGCDFALVGGLRSAVLFGETKYTADGPDPGEDDFVWTVDTGVGVEYCYCTCNGTFAVRAMVEGNVWSVGGKDPNEFIDTDTSTDEDMAFLGYVFGVEYRQ